MPNEVDGLEIAVVVARAQEGDELAFAELYVCFFDRVYRYLRMQVDDPHEAQDLAQDVFVRLIKVLPDYDPARGPFRAWIFSIARNLAIDDIRKRGRMRATAPDALEEQLERAAPLADGAIGSIIDSLPKPQRRVLVLRFLYELPAADIADIVGSTPAAVRQLQHRGLRALAATFTPESAAA